MKKGIQKVLVMLLALSMIFSTMALPAYADDTGLADGTYNANGLSTAVLSMYLFHDAQIVVKGDNAWLITTEDTDKTVKRFDGMAYGPQSQILDPADTSNHTLVEGTPTATVVPIYNDEGELETRTFVLPVPKSVVESGSDIFYMIKYTAGYSEEHDGDWYKADGGDYYLTGYTLEKVSDSTALPGEEPVVEPVELEITNNTGMFKADTASAIANADGSATLTFALSGTSYHWLYKGTYEEALAANDTIAASIASDEASGNLIKGYENAEGKWVFEMTIGADELGEDIAIVSISDNYYQKYLNGQNSLERAYYPRQFNLDMDAETLVTGDFDMNYEFELTTELDDFKAVTPVSVHIVGGPNSNNYKVEPTLVMGDETYDKVTFPSTADPKEAVLTDGAFAISMVNQQNNAAFKDKTPLEFTFHVAENAPYEEAGTDVVRTVTFDQVAKTITVEGTALTPKDTPAPSYTAGEYIVGVHSIKYASGDNYTMFIPTYQGEQNKALVNVDEQGDATISFTTEKKTYKAIILAELESGSTAGCLNQLPTEDQMASGAYINATTNAENSGYRDFAFTFNVGNLGKTVPYVTVSNSSGKFNAAQLAFVFDKTMTSKAAYEVVGLIDALPAAADVTVRNKEAIEAARAAYDALTDGQKAEVSNYDKLVAAETAYAALPEKDEATTAAEAAIESLIQKYIDVNETTAAAVEAAREAYDALSVQQAAYISDETYQKLVRAEACVQFADPEVRESGIIVDAGINTDSGLIVGTVLGGPNSDTYLYIYTDPNTKLKKVSGTVSQSNQKVIGDGKLMETIWILGTTEPHGREFVVQPTDLNGNAKGDEITVKIPGVYDTLAKGTYEVAAIQTPSSKMRKFERSTITSDGAAMSVEFVMPNTSYGKIFLGTKEEAESATEGFIEPTGTEATSGTTGEGNVYTIPLESMYMPIPISYYSTKNGTWTQEIVEFVVDEQSGTAIDAIAALNLNTYFNVKIDQRDQVALADGLYQALNDNQKAVVENANYSTLKKVVAMFVEADKVAAQIEALPAADAITEDDVAKVREVKDAFDNMGKDPDLVEALNGNSLQNSQIEKLITKELRDKLNACAAAVPADYTAVDAALAAVPADLSIYTEETAKAVTDAVEAVDRTKTLSEQVAVDAMAKAINDAVAGLKIDIAKAQVTGLSTQTYSGKAFTPAPVVTLNGETLNPETDYTVSYTDNTNAGTATVTITGNGDYAGTVTATFTIAKAAQSITGPAVTITKTYGDAAFNLSAKTNGSGTLTYQTSTPSVATVDSKGNVSIKGAGSAIITINASETDNYTAGSKTVTLTVNKKAQAITGPAATITKTFGNAAFSLNAKADGGGKLTYSSSNTKVVTVNASGKVTIKGAGTAKIIVTAAATNNYNAAKKEVTIKVNKAANTLKTSGKKVTVSATTVKKGNKTIAKAKAFKVSKAKGKVTFAKKSGNAKIKVSKAGKITVKKGLKKGTYKVKVKVTAAGNSNYKKLTKTVTVTIKVK